MSLSKLLVSLQFAASASASSVDAFDHVPLPGLTEKAHLQHLSRENLSLDLLFDSKDKDFDKWSPIDLATLEEMFDENHPNPDIKPRIIKHSHPKVQSAGSAYCGRAVDRLKAGPVNIPDLMCKNEKYADPDFDGTN